MILETFVVLNASVLATKMIYKNVVDNHATYNKIVNDGLYHITSSENVDKILESGTLNPSSYINSLGSKKVFFFAGIPSFQDLTTNAAYELNNETLYALKVNPSYEDMANLKSREYNDKAITYEGKYKIENATKVEMVYDVDKNDNIIIREKTKEELEKYEQPKELKERLQSKSKFMTMLKGMGISYFKEFQSLGKLVKNESLALVKKINKKEMIDQLKAEREKLMLESYLSNETTHSR